MLKRISVFAVLVATFLFVGAPARAVTVNVTYTDGANEGFFDATLGASRRTAFEAAASQWAQTLGGTVPITVQASFDNLGGEDASGLAVLGFAGPSFFFKDFTGAPQTSTFFAVALGNQLAGGDLDPASADIVAQFNNQVDTSSVFGSTGFYYGTDLNAGNNIDFYSVVLHEIGHGLGFLDGMNTNGTFSFGDPSVWDRHLTNSSAAGATLFPSLSQTQRQNAMISDALFFSGTNTRAANANLNANLYAPNPFQSGSSVAHLDETKYSPPPDGTAANTVEELMTPINSADTHTVGPILRGILRDIGWTLQAALPTVSISDVTVTEGDSGSLNAVLTLTLSASSASSVTVQFATAAGSATAGSDYTTSSGTVTFAAGQTTRTVSVPVLGDNVIEGDETFFVNLTTPTNATIADAQGVVLISDDDANAIPVNGTLSAVSATDAPGTLRRFTTTYSDANGNADFGYVMLHINNSTSAYGAFRCELNTVNNKLYLRNDDNTAWLGGFAVGAARTITNGQGSVDCAQTTITRNGNTITVVWAIKATGAWAGTTQKTFLFSQDSKKAQDGFDQKGTWTITGNVAPSNTSITPTSTTSTANQARSITAVYSDANGSGNLAQTILRIGSTTANGFRAFYNPLTNKILVLNDAGTAYVGGIAPGAVGTVGNSRGSINCALTTVTRNTGNITINWNITLKTTSWVGTTQNVSLFCKDRAGLSDGFENFGSWTLGAPLMAPLGAAPELSSALSASGSQAVTLIFSGALNEAAGDPSRYNVTVNGAPVSVQRAEISRAQVVLRLTRALRAGDLLTVAWSNLPGSGRTELVIP